MCFRGVFSIWSQRPSYQMNKIWLNGVPASGGLAAVDTYIEPRRKLNATETYEGPSYRDLIAAKGVFEGLRERQRLLPKPKWKVH